MTLLRLPSLALKPGGRFVSFDGCFVEGQSDVARWLLQVERGKFVRPATTYCELASRVCDEVRSEVRSELLRVPYSHILLECKGAKLTGE